MMDNNNDGLRHLSECFAGRLRSLPFSLSQMEEDRLALAMIAVLSRQEYEPSDFREWLDACQSLWTPLVLPLLPGTSLAVRTLHSLHTLLHLGATLDGVTLRPAYPAETLEAVQKTLRSFTSYLGDA